MVLSLGCKHANRQVFRHFQRVADCIVRLPIPIKISYIEPAVINKVNKEYALLWYCVW